MNKQLACLFFLTLCACETAPNPNPEVRYYGALKNMMHKGDISASVDLSTLKDLEHLYGLGAVEGLKGEVLIWDSQYLIAQKKNHQLQLSNQSDHKATLFVCSQVAEWSEHVIPQEVKTYQELEDFLGEFVLSQGLSNEHPFPFLLEGRFTRADWHVIDWADGDMEHSHEKHITSGLHNRLSDERAAVLGFYSTSHQGIFTHHSSKMHLHIRSMEGDFAAHLDDLILGDGVVLKLPDLGVGNEGLGMSITE